MNENQENPWHSVGVRCTSQGQVKQTQKITYVLSPAAASGWITVDASQIYTNGYGRGRIRIRANPFGSYNDGDTFTITMRWHDIHDRIASTANVYITTNDGRSVNPRSDLAVHAG